MRGHLRREQAHRPTPGPAHHIRIRISADEYTRAHAAGQNLDTWIRDRITDALRQPE